MSRVEHLAEGVTLYLGDCREILPTLGKVDAVVTDPPYGINAARDRKSQKHGWRDYDAPGWDKERPPADLIALILGSAKHTIVWGGNYFTDTLPPSSKWLSWDKGQTDFSLADFELAWCSFDGAARRIMLPRSVALQDGKEHPTQKPVEVMRWCLQRLPKGCNSILDPFMGSGTTGVAAVNMGLGFTGIELEPKFFEVSCRRITDELRRLSVCRTFQARKAGGDAVRLVIIESPYAGDVEENIKYARRCVRDSLSRGEAPIASHLLYTQPGVLRDHIAEERQWGIDAGLAWKAVAQASVVYTDRGITKGMEYGIAAAKAAGVPVEYRSIEEMK